MHGPILIGLAGLLAAMAAGARSLAPRPASIVRPASRNSANGKLFLRRRIPPLNPALARRLAALEP